MKNLAARLKAIESRRHIASIVKLVVSDIRHASGKPHEASGPTLVALFALILGLPFLIGIGGIALYGFSQLLSWPALGSVSLGITVLSWLFVAMVVAGFLLMYLSILIILLTSFLVLVLTVPVEILGSVLAHAPKNLVGTVGALLTISGLVMQLAAKIGGSQ